MTLSTTLNPLNSTRNLTMILSGRCSIVVLRESNLITTSHMIGTNLKMSTLKCTIMSQKLFWKGLILRLYLKKWIKMFLKVNWKTKKFRKGRRMKIKNPILSKKNDLISLVLIHHSSFPSTFASGTRFCSGSMFSSGDFISYCSGCASWFLTSFSSSSARCPGWGIYSAWGASGSGTSAWGTSGSGNTSGRDTTSGSGTTSGWDTTSGWGASWGWASSTWSGD